MIRMFRKMLTRKKQQIVMQRWRQKAKECVDTKMQKCVRWVGGWYIAMGSQRQNLKPREVSITTSLFSSISRWVELARSQRDIACSGAAKTVPAAITVSQLEFGFERYAAKLTLAARRGATCFRLLYSQ
jgi:hypothetical protein